jgi:glucan 1,3-beta-glucosidase
MAIGSACSGRPVTAELTLPLQSVLHPFLPRLSFPLPPSLSSQAHLLPVVPFLVDPGLEMEHSHGSETPLNLSRSHTPDQPVFNEPLLPPAAPFLAPSESSPTPRDSYLTNNSAPLLPEDGEKDLPPLRNLSGRGSKPLHKRPLIWALAAAAIALIVVAVIVPVYFVVIKPKTNTVDGNSNSPNDNGNGNGKPSPTHQPPTNNTSGGNGTTITTQDGTQFTYINQFGGICKWSSIFPPCITSNTILGVSDPNDPFNDDAYPNSWTPPLNTSWTWGQDKLYGYATILYD